MKIQKLQDDQQNGKIAFHEVLRLEWQIRI